MKPIQLVMSAFGSYAEEVTIDFTKTDHGIFLITGDTGAGKTTLFDAVTYALYDQTSGGKRDGNMMRSQYASLDTPTYVKFTFTYGGQGYTIVRNPEYQRERKRRSAEGALAYTTEKPKVELFLPDGSIFMGNKNETNKKIVDIMGLDAQQFTQIAMIAQGDFLKLLHAQSKERKIIFSKIFNTRIYWDIQERLKYREKVCRDALEDNKKDCIRELEQISCSPENPNWEDVQQLADTPNREETEKVLQALLYQGEEEEKILQRQYLRNKEELEENQRHLDMAQTVNQLFDGLESAVQEQQQQDRYRQEMLEKQQRLLRGEKADRVRKDELIYLNGKEVYEKLHRDLLNLYTKISIQEQSAAGAAEASQKYKERYQEQTPLLHAAIAKIQNLLPRYQKISELEVQASDAEKQQRVSGDITKKYQEICIRYEELYESYLGGAAGMLAAELQEDRPCPVCGSVLHPQKAVLSSDVPSKELLDQVKNERNVMEKKEADAKEQYRLALEVQKEIQRLKEELPFAKKKQAQDEVVRLQDELHKIGRQAEEAEGEWQKLQQEMRAAAAQQELLEQQEKQAEQSFRDAEILFRKAVEESGFNSEEDYRSSRLALEEQKKIENQLTVYREKVIQVGAAVKLYQIQTKDKSRVDTQVLTQKLKVLSEGREELDQKLKVLFSHNSKNREASVRLSGIFDKREKLKNTYQIVGTLSRTANGTLNKSIKLDFETYIQRQFFKQMIHLANQRFVRMTSNQLALRCREVKDLGTQGQAGLDLDVYSPVTNSTRDVKTLSGGESFLAALSMALGLADVIQNTAGAIRLDTMFIDEGFGSLDDEAREQAIQILDELAGSQRLVGIISHVSELKEQIDRKLIVEKLESGSSVRWVF